MFDFSGKFLKAFRFCLKFDDNNVIFDELLHIIKMKRFIFLFFPILFINNLFSQLNKNSKFSVDLFCQPNFESYTGTIPNATISTQNLDVDLGAFCNYFITDRLNIGTGLKFHNTNYTFSQNIDLDNPTNNIWENVKFTNNFSYLSIPLKIGYAVFFKKKICISPYIGCGFDFIDQGIINKSAMYFTKPVQTIPIIPVNSSIPSSQYLWKLSLSAFAGVDFIFQLRTKVDLVISPNYNVMYLPNNPTPIFLYPSDSKIHLWNLGCSFGIRKRMKIS